MTLEDVATELEELYNNNQLTLDEYQRLKKIFRITKQSFCEACGKSMQAGSTFCPYCGDKQGV